MLATFTNIFAAKEDYSLSSWWRLEGESSREAGLNTKGDNTSLIVILNLKRKVQNWAEIRVSPGFRFATGNGQGLIFDDRPRNSLFANEAVFATRFSTFNITLGSVNQRQVGIRSIVNPYVSFPGALFSAKLFSNKTFTTRVVGQAAIPNSYTYSDNANAFETSPRFYTAALKLNYRGSSIKRAHLDAVYFNYTGLPQVVAVDSATRGNTVDLTSSTTGTFRYAFKGYGVTTGLTMKTFMPFDFITRVEWATNPEATAGRDSAIRTWLGGKTNLSNNTSLKILGLYYRQESDIAPSSLNYGRDLNNRLGHGVRASYKLKKEQMSFIAGFEHSDPIFKSSIMAARDVFYFRIEGYDDIF